MASKALVIHDPVSKEEIELTDKESKQYQEILNTAVQLEEKHNQVIAEIQEEYKKFLKMNDQHYKKYKELEAELKKGKITTDSFTSIDNLSYNTIQTELIQSQDKIAVAESENNLEVAKHKEVLEKFQGTVVNRHRLEKAKVEYNRIKEDIDRSKLIVATLKQQVKKPPHHITEVSLAYLQRDLKKYQYHANLLERRRARRYKICRKEKPPPKYEDTHLMMNLSIYNANLDIINISSALFRITQHIPSVQQQETLERLAALPSVAIKRITMELMGEVLQETLSSDKSFWLHPSFLMGCIGFTVSIMSIVACIVKKKKAAWKPPVLTGFLSLCRKDKNNTKMDDEDMDGSIY